jgi:predicted component of type VI protein secretion system
MSLILTVVTPAESLPGDRSMVFAASGGRIGRGFDNDWVLPDPKRYLSVCHARVEQREGYWYIEDLSTNGVYLNDSRQPLSILPPRALTHGDSIRMGAYRMAVAIEGEMAVSVNDTAVEEMLVDYSGEMPSLTLEVAHTAASAASSHGASSSPPASVPPSRPLFSPDLVSAGDRRNQQRPTPGQGGEIDAFCKGLGIDVSQLPQQSHCPALFVAGLIMREALVGARELAATQRALRDSHGLAQPETDPRFIPLQHLSTEDLMRHVMSVSREQGLDTMHWLRELFGNARRYDVAMSTALSAALADYLQRLDPQRLGAAGSLPERYRSITEAASNGLPLLFSEALVHAFATAQAKA